MQNKLLTYLLTYLCCVAFSERHAAVKAGLAAERTSETAGSTVWSLDRPATSAQTRRTTGSSSWSRPASRTATTSFLQDQRSGQLRRRSHEFTTTSLTPSLATICYHSSVFSHTWFIHGGLGGLRGTGKNVGHSPKFIQGFRVRPGGTGNKRWPLLKFYDLIL